MAVAWLKRLLGGFGRDAAPPPLGAVPPATSIDEVIVRMRGIAARLPEDDGIAHFNRMYLHVTEEVRGEIRARRFEDAEFLERLDVVFANFYFQALEECASGVCPKAWEPVFHARGSHRIAPLQFALAGMNAHINHDLVLAIVQTCAEFERSPERGSPQHRDFEHVNVVLERAKEEIEPSFKRGILGIVDRVVGRVDEIAEMWSIVRARDAAWVNAETLWTIREVEDLSSRFRLTLARTVGLAGRGLLVESPVPLL